MAQRQILDLQAESTKISYERYKHLYEESRDSKPHSEDFLLSFIAEKAKFYAATTLWTMYTLLKKYLLLECSFDVGAGERIAHFLKTLTRHHKKKQAPAFTRDELFTYLRTEISEGKTLINKLVLLVGFYGGLRTSEITALTWEDLSFSSDGILVTVKRSKTDSAGIGAVKLLPKLEESLICPVFYFSKYKSDVGQTSGRLFRQYQNGKFTKMAGGKNTIADVPKQIAKFLNLEDAPTYTGHALRVSSATVMADAGANILTLKRHGRWASESIAEGYVRGSKKTRIEAAALLAGTVTTVTNNEHHSATTTDGLTFNNCVFNGPVVFEKDK